MQAVYLIMLNDVWNSSEDVLLWHSERRFPIVDVNSISTFISWGVSRSGGAVISKFLELPDVERGRLLRQFVTECIDVGRIADEYSELRKSSRVVDDGGLTSEKVNKPYKACTIQNWPKEEDDKTILGFRYANRSNYELLGVKLDDVDYTVLSGDSLVAFKDHLASMLSDVEEKIVADRASVEARPPAVSIVYVLYLIDECCAIGGSGITIKAGTVSHSLTINNILEDGTDMWDMVAHVEKFLRDDGCEHFDCHGEQDGSFNVWDFHFDFDANYYSVMDAK